MQSPKPLATTSANEGSRTSTVPSEMRFTPSSRSWSMRASERTPPPASTEMPSTSQIALMAVSLAARAASSSSKALERSMT